MQRPRSISAVAGRPYGAVLRQRCCNQPSRFPARRALRPDHLVTVVKGDVAGRPHGASLRKRCCNQHRFPARRALSPCYPMTVVNGGVAGGPHGASLRQRCCNRPRNFRRDALCGQILRPRRADYRDCGDDSNDDATLSSRLESRNGVAPNFVCARRLPSADGCEGSLHFASSYSATI